LYTSECAAYGKGQRRAVLAVAVFVGLVGFTVRSGEAYVSLQLGLWEDEGIGDTDSVREEKGGTYGVSVDFELDKDDKPNATMKISYNADPSRYNELNPIVYQQLKNIANNGPAASSMQKVKEYLIKQYAQAAITNDYWSYIIWHEIDDDTDFDRDYCKMVSDMTAANVQRMAQQLLAAKRCIEVTMLSE
jgi:zinc protease